MDRREVTLQSNSKYKGRSTRGQFGRGSEPKLKSYHELLSLGSKLNCKSFFPALSVFQQRLGINPLPREKVATDLRSGFSVCASPPHQVARRFLTTQKSHTVLL